MVIVIKMGMKKNEKIIDDEEENPEDFQKHWNEYQRQMLSTSWKILDTLRLILEEVKKPLGG